LLRASVACALLAFVPAAAAHPQAGLGAFRVLPFLGPGFPGLPQTAHSTRQAALSPGPASVRVIGCADPGGGFNADVVAHRGYAYLGSWGNASGASSCPS